MKLIRVKCKDAEIDPLAKEKMPYVKRAIEAAKKSLVIWENKFPQNKAPRKAIEAAEVWVNNPTSDSVSRSLMAAKLASAASHDGVIWGPVAPAASATRAAAESAAANNMNSCISLSKTAIQLSGVALQKPSSYTTAEIEKDLKRAGII